MKRALDLAQKSKIPRHLPFAVQRIGAIGTDDSKKLLKELNDRVGKLEHSSESHELQALIAKALEPGADKQTAKRANHEGHED